MNSFTKQMKYADMIPNSQIDLGIQGSRYFSNDYQSGELWLTENRHFSQKELQYKFDEVENAVQVRLPDGKEILLDAKEVVLFRLGEGKTAVNYMSSVVPNSFNLEPKIFQVLYASKHTVLLKLPHKILKSVENMSVPTLNQRYQEYRDESQLFIKLNRKPYTKIERRTKRGLIEAMPSKKSKLNYLYDNVPKFADTNNFTDALLIEIAREVDIKKAAKEAESEQ